MADQGFREIQLQGKQLVFLFMAATVVAVVVFLCGVMVGRGVQGSVVGSVEQASFYPGGAEQDLSPARAASTDREAPLTAQETLTYSRLLEDPEPPVETLAPPDAEPPTVVSEPEVLTQRPSVSPQPGPAIATPPVVASTTAPRTPPRIAPAMDAPAATPSPATVPVVAASGSTLTEPPGSGFVVQVAAVRQLAQANAIASGLAAKGYPAFVTVSGPNFRVRVGKYADRGEAASVAGRLEREERFTPWITR